MASGQQSVEVFYLANPGFSELLSFDVTSRVLSLKADFVKELAKGRFCPRSDAENVTFNLISDVLGSSH